MGQISPPNLPPSGSPPPPPDDDPDAEGLPSHITLPERGLYMRTQLRARAILCVAGLMVVGMFWYANRGYSSVFGICFGLIVLTLLVTLFRLWRVSRGAARDAATSTQDSTEHD